MSVQENTVATTATNVKAAPQTHRQVPTLSLASYAKGTQEEKLKFIDSLYKGLKDYGFIILKDHGVEPALLHKAYSLLEQFYKLPEATKRSYISKAGGGQRGYTPFGQEHAKDAQVMDLKEFWHVGREVADGHPLKDKYYPDNIWPTEVPEFKAVFTELYKGLEDAGQIMLEALTFPLNVEKDFFKKMTFEGNSILRLLHYPAIPEGTDPRCLRAAPHEDINFITLLPAATASGLQLKDRDGSWLDIVSEPDTLIVDAGDMLARLTNDVIPSTTHQVINSPEAKNKPRYSMPFFMHPNPHAMLSCLASCRGAGAKYPDITGGDFLMQRLREIGLIK